MLIESAQLSHKVTNIKLDTFQMECNYGKNIVEKINVRCHYGKSRITIQVYNNGREPASKFVYNTNTHFIVSIIAIRRTFCKSQWPRETARCSSTFLKHKSQVRFLVGVFFFFF